MNHSPGAPIRLTKKQLEKLKQTIVDSVPHDVGFTARHNWTLEIIAAFIKREFGQTLDNTRIHHAKLLTPFLNEMKDRLELVFLPPYSPELNAVEGLWKWLKSDVINNVFYHTVTEIRTNVLYFERQGICLSLS